VDEMGAELVVAEELWDGEIDVFGTLIDVVEGAVLENVDTTEELDGVEVEEMLRDVEIDESVPEEDTEDPEDVADNKVLEELEKLGEDELELLIDAKRHWGIVIWFVLGPTRIATSESGGGAGFEQLNVVNVQVPVSRSKKASEQVESKAQILMHSSNKACEL
jgi:hypothetical protein